MAKLPTFDQLTAERPQPNSGVASYRATTGAETALGEAAASVGNAIESESDKLWTLARHEQEKADTVQVEDAWNKYKSAQLDLMRGPNGLLNTQGEDAIKGDLWDKAVKGMDAAKTQIAQGLGNDQQRARFTQRANVTDLETKHETLVHLVNQQKKYAATTMDGSQAAAEASVAANPGDDGAFLKAKDVLLDQTDVYLKGLGIANQGAIDDERAKRVDALWNTRITALRSMGFALQADELFRGTPERPGASGQIKNPQLRQLLKQQTEEAAVVMRASLRTDENIAEAMSNLLKKKATEPRATPEQGPAKPGTIEISGTPEDATARAQAASDKARDDTTGRRAALEQVLTEQKPGTKEHKAALAELEKIDLQQAAQPQQRVAMTAGPAVAEFNTTETPTAKDVAALYMPLMGQIQTQADALYGKDKTNPARLSYVAHAEADTKAKLGRVVEQITREQQAILNEAGDYVQGLTPQTGAPGAGGVVQAGGRTGGPGVIRVTSYPMLQAMNPELFMKVQRLDSAGKTHIAALMDAAQRATEQGNPALFNEYRYRISLPPDNPDKINWPQQISQDPRTWQTPMSIAQWNALKSDLKDMATDDGRSQQAKMASGEKLAAAMFRNTLLFPALTNGGISMGNAEYAQSLWSINKDKIVGEYKQQSKRIDELFDPNSKESLVSVQALAPFANQATQGTTGQALAAGANQVKAGAAQPIAAQTIVDAPATIKTAEELTAWVKALPPTITHFRAPGDPPGAARLIQRPSADQPAVVAPAMDEQGKIVQPAPAPILTPASIKVPELIDEPPKRGARGMTPEQLAQRDQITGGLAAAGAAVATAPIRAAAVAGEAAITGAKVVGRALSATEAERAVASFRQLLSSGKYTRATAPIIEGAITSGLLTVLETQSALAMLRKIGTKKP